ncbi:DUF726 domain-containing protein [Nocardioides sp. CFH 31398]|uniref:DUF726 domain-containing protein n=1 Tax=Nocardioides sp. CFH 31398 TaxID=2919579 RepID=UPI001F05BB2E|nr:DUF726 domain-containing protein [Nocardioides sp. CFH 31398]MCH1867422.1 DUF726 domain-containing protein [Nocardioides sp. CFH 31398]
MAELTYTPRGRGFAVDLSAGSLDLHVKGAGLDHDSPQIGGSSDLTDNVALMALVLGYAANELAYRRLRSPEKRKSHRDAADNERVQAIGLAELIVRAEASTSDAWCSGCFTFSPRRRVRKASRPVETWLCAACGTPSVGCAVPRCKNHAVVHPLARTNLRYCAEHQHEIPSFEKLEATFCSLLDYEDFLSYDVRNAARITKVTGGMIGAALVVAPMALLAAPAVGAALGGSALGGSLTGAAATSHGLAMLGGGAVASGGLGMAGGTMVVTATGSALGSALGATTVSAYTSSDKSFRIEKVRDGTGTPVIFATGFLTEGLGGWTGWQPLVDQRYPDSPVYQLHWGSKELKDLSVLLVDAGVKAVVHRLVKAGAKRGGKALNLPGIGWALGLAGVAANPWTVAKTRAGMTGVALGTLLARCDEGPFVLMGHSLGARVMVTAAETLSTKPGAKKVEEMHLLGAAVNKSRDWRSLHEAVNHRVWNYWSAEDDVLRWLYRLAELTATPAGQAGFTSKFTRISDRNVTKNVRSHSAYIAHVKLATRASRDNARPHPGA